MKRKFFGGSYSIPLRSTASKIAMEQRKRDSIARRDELCENEGR